jgi:N-methylhydantoinase A
VTWTLALAQPFTLPERIPAPPEMAAPAPTGRARVIDPASGDSVDTAVYSRAALPAGTRLGGPAIITESGTSTIVPPGFSARVGAAGELLIEDAMP